MVVESLIWWSASFVMNLWWFSKLDHGTAMWIFYFGIPYIVFASWLVLVTFLHHNQPGTTWFSDSKWSYVKGNLVTIDRNYGLIEQIHHNIGTHLVHHLFPKIPHYHLREATKYLLPVVEPHRVAASESARIIPTYFYNWRVYSSHFTTPNNSLSHSYPK
jgi:omega-3 fatty acid desaturase (delta-15 desaturase)